MDKQFEVESKISPTSFSTASKSLLLNSLPLSLTHNIEFESNSKDIRMKSLRPANFVEQVGQMSSNLSEKRKQTMYLIKTVISYLASFVLRAMPQPILEKQSITVKMYYHKARLA
jgi:hypothetical protein